MAIVSPGAIPAAASSSGQCGGIAVQLPIADHQLGGIGLLATWLPQIDVRPLRLVLRAKPQHLDERGRLGRRRKARYRTHRPRAVLFERKRSLLAGERARDISGRSRFRQHSFRKRYSDLGLESGQELDALEAPQPQVAIEQGVRPQTGESPLGAQLVEQAGERFENATLRSSAVQLLSWLHSFIRGDS